MGSSDSHGIIQDLNRRKWLLASLALQARECMSTYSKYFSLPLRGRGNELCVNPISFFSLFFLRLDTSCNATAHVKPSL